MSFRIRLPKKDKDKPPTKVIKTTEMIISIPGIDGCLVGNSSLDGEQFAIIASKIKS